MHLLGRMIFPIHATTAEDAAAAANLQVFEISMLREPSNIT